jgi:flagellar motor switch protein FliM
MTGTSDLSGEEVAALMEELTDVGGDIGVDAAASGEVRPFALGQEAFRPMARLAGLERMGERLARRFRAMIEPYARTKVQVTADPIENRRFEDWRADLPDFTSLSLYRLRPLKGGMLIVLEPTFVANLVNSFYGGNGAGIVSKVGEFTASEERLLGRLTESMIDILVELWAEVVPLAPTLASRETNAAYASLVRPDEAVVVQRFTVVPGAGRPTVISILYPLATLRPIEAELASKVHDDSEGDSEWRMRLSAALENVRLPVRSVLARPELSVAQLMALKPGDVIPVTLSPTVPLLVGQKHLAEGSIGEQDGRAALMIQQIGKGTPK